MASSPPQPVAGLEAWRPVVEQALEAGIAKSQSLGGTIDAAAFGPGWGQPVVIGATGATDTFRMWSVSKPITAVAVLSALEAGGRPLNEAVRRSIVEALTESDNCAQRRDVVALQRLTGGVADADSAFRATLAKAGATTVGDSTPAPWSSDDLVCAPFFQETAAGLTTAQVEAPAIQFGTYEWTIVSAVRFAYALGAGEYGEAGAAVLGWMRRPKEFAAESTPQDYTSPLNLPPSGGRFPLKWLPAYKGGWGGHEENDFISEQIDVLDVDGSTIALAALYRPATQPPSDDPGLTEAPQALEDVFRSARRALVKLSRTTTPA
jgi:hypothetical protein